MGRRLLDKLVDRAGGTPRAKVIAAFACVLAVDGADKGAVGAMAAPLQHDLGISMTDIGWLLSASLVVGAFASLPMGWLVDRINRTRLLFWCVVAWAAAMLLSAFADSFITLLLPRLLLAGVAASAQPAVASLVGDRFPEAERSTVFGYILAGELIGTGIGFVVAGELAMWTWRAGFIALAAPAVLLAWALFRLPEPAREGKGVLRRGKEDFSSDDGAGDGYELRRVQELAHEKQVPVRARLVLDKSPQKESLWWAMKYVLRVPSMVILILASALGYFFFSGLRTFGVQYLTLRFEVSQAAGTAILAAAGGFALGGVLVTGYLADAFIRRGRLRSRVVIAWSAYMLACFALLGAMFATTLALTFALLAAAACGFGAVNPPLDAGRLDLIHPGLWGRAEAVRTLLRQAGEAVAPLTFGFIAEEIYGNGRATAHGLHHTFLVMLVPLFIGALVALFGIATYARDVATAGESVRRTIAHA